MKCLREVQYLCLFPDSGVLQTRMMKKLPKTKCWKVGSCKVDVVDAIHKFNSNWDTDLIIGRHDCRHYTNGIKNLRLQSHC